jgi:hypothetical protein
MAMDGQRTGTAKKRSVGGGVKEPSKGNRPSDSVDRMDAERASERTLRMRAEHGLIDYRIESV